MTKWGWPMFANLKSMNLSQQAEYLTKALVKMKSYNHSDGERHKADFLKEIIHSYPSFNDNDNLVWTQEIPGDELGRKNVFAFLKGRSGGKRTILYLAHLDTVGTEDFGPIQGMAHDPDKLQEFFVQYGSDPEVQEDALSEEWLFGRGALDMQSGVAVHLANLLFFSENPDELNGNLLVMFNADEEGEHKGSRAALAELLRLKEKWAWNTWLQLIMILSRHCMMGTRQSIYTPVQQEKSCRVSPFSEGRPMQAKVWQGLIQH